jgi:hypothetical protein
VPSAGVRFAGEAAFLVLVALGLGLARFSPIVIGVVMFVAWVLVALLERASAQEAARAAEPASEEAVPIPPPHVERVEVEPAREHAAEAPEVLPEPTEEPEREPAVDERTARAILASAPPPLPPAPPTPQPEQKPAPRRVFERRAAPPPPPPPPAPEPEPAAVVSRPPREWNVWELQRAVRGRPEDERHGEWAALLIHLREFANADGDLPLEFDALVRESFAALLTEEAEPAAAP